MKKNNEHIKSSGSVYHSLGDIERVVNDNLCARCGACAICPLDAINWDENYYPSIDRNKCTDCGMCKAACPGEELNIPALASEIYGDNADWKNPLGVIQQSYIAYSSNPEVRMKGAGGGVVTQLLLSLMKSGQIDGAIVIGHDPVRPWRSKPVVATTQEEIRACAGSRYSVVPTLMALPEIRRHSGRFALVTLPCQTHGYRLVQKVAPAIAKNIALVIGIYCGSNREIDATVALIEGLGGKLGEVQSVEYRAGAWPGNFRLKSRDGSVREVTLRIYNYTRFMYEPIRCTTCVDLTNEFADISVGDAWFRGKDGRYPYKECSTVLARTEKGLEIVNQLCEDNSLRIMSAPSHIFEQQHRKNTFDKKVIAYQRTRTPGGNKPDYHVSIDNISLRKKMHITVWNLGYSIAQNNGVRRLAMLFLLSPIGIRFMELFEARKQFKELNWRNIRDAFKVMFTGKPIN